MPKKPTVLVIVSDDQGFADVSWTGGVIPTPNLERIRNESTVLENFYVHPVCTPSRASLLTGKYAGHSAMTGPLLLAAPCKLKAEDKEATLATEMKRRGYYTSLSGKWHLGHHANEDTPTGHGFDDFYGVLKIVVRLTTPRITSPPSRGTRKTGTRMRILLHQLRRNIHLRYSPIIWSKSSKNMAMNSRYSLCFPLQHPTLHSNQNLTILSCVRT